MGQTEQNVSGQGRIPKGIWILGLVSLLMDTSSEMIHALLPIFLAGTLGASVATIGLIEGVAEATASVTKVFSGAFSDWIGKRKALAALGYGLAALTKPLFAIGPTVGWIAGARFLDRVGKGIRGAPRDALVADLSPPELQGASFGLRQSLDTVGAFLGPLLAVLLMILTADRFRLVFWIAAIPAVLSFLLIFIAVREPREQGDSAHRKPLHFSSIWRLGMPFWTVTSVGAVFSLARFSEAFLILRSEHVGLSIALVPMVLVAMNLAYAASAYPAGVLSDRFGRLGLLATGLLLLLAADLVLAGAGSVPALALGVVLWGFHMGCTQGIFSALVADTAPERLRGTAFGVYNLVSGLALLAASVVAGVLWDAEGPSVTFLAGATLSVICLAGLFPLRTAVRNG